MLWSSTVWGATLVWDPDSTPNLAGYRVYQCSQLPCAQTSGNASLLATLGTVTSFNIGTPAVTEYYFVTAYDLSNNESGPSNLATFTPAGTPPPVLPPAIGVSPTSLSFTATQGGANPATQTLSISNTGGGTLSWTTSDNAAWLTLSPASGTGNGAVTLSVTTGTLTVGSYSATVTMSAPGASSVTVPVTFTVATAPVPPAIGASPTSLSFTATQGGANPATQTLSISNTGGGTLSWTTSDNAAWLTLSPASGTGNGVVTASVVTGTTTVGTYNGSITLNAPGAPSATVPVTFTVTTAPPPPPPPPPAAPPTPNGLHITAVQ
jgi:BACON domain-containing protein